MEFTISLKDGRMEVRTSGSTDLPQFLAMHESVLGSPDWKAGTPLLMDHRHLDTSPLSATDLLAIVDDVAARNETIGASKVAFLVGRNLEFGLSRMWIFNAGDRWKGQATAFRDKSQAIAWLTGTVV